MTSHIKLFAGQSRMTSYTQNCLRVNYKIKHQHKIVCVCILFIKFSKSFVGSVKNDIIYLKLFAGSVKNDIIYSKSFARSVKNDIIYSKN